MKNHFDYSGQFHYGMIDRTGQIYFIVIMDPTMKKPKDEFLHSPLGYRALLFEFLSN